MSIKGLNASYRVAVCLRARVFSVAVSVSPRVLVVVCRRSNCSLVVRRASRHSDPASPADVRVLPDNSRRLRHLVARPPLVQARLRGLLDLVVRHDRRHCRQTGRHAVRHVKLASRRPRLRLLLLLLLLLATCHVRHSSVALSRQPQHQTITTSRRRRRRPVIRT